MMIFNRQDVPLGELAEADVFALEHRREINGEHALEITTTRILGQGQRVLMQDDRSRWHEFVVYGIDQRHANGERAIGTYYCPWSVQPDLMGTRVSKMPGVRTPVAAASALEDALSGTARWNRGTVTNTAAAGASMYDTDGWDALGTLVGTWGGELDVTIEAGSTGVTARKVDLRGQLGSQDARRRFDFGSDLLGVKRTIPDGPLYCRIAPRGKGEETEAGGYGRKITIESVNGGKDYLVNPDMVGLAKLPDGAGGWEYPTLKVENPDCETPADLKAWAESVLEEFTVPKVSYEVDVLQLGREGIDMQGVSLGDAVHIVDGKLGIRLSGRVVSMVTDELAGRSTKLTIGYIQEGLAGLMDSFSSRISMLTNAVQAMNGGTLATAEYLSRLIDRLNAEINATGGYTYITEGHGLRTYDKAVSDPLVGAEASKVVELRGGSIRIADSRTAQGEWDWKTLIVSGHVAAELVTAANLTAGFIGSPSGNYWNLDTGELRMASTTTVDGKTLAEYIAENSEVDPEEITLSQKKVFDALTDNGRLPGVFMKDGQLYVNANYLKTGILTDNVGRNCWNLDTGEFALSAASTVGGKAVASEDKALAWANSALAKANASSTAKANKALALANGYADDMASDALALADGAATAKANAALKKANEQSARNANSALRQAKDDASAKANKALKDAKAHATRQASDALGKAKKDAASKASKALTDAKTYTNAISKKDRQYTADQRRALDNSLTQRDVLRRLTGGFKAKGIWLKGGQLYVNGDYVRTGTLDAGIVKAGILSDRGGKNKWNMATGYLETRNAVMRNANVTGQFSAGDYYKTVLRDGRLSGYRDGSRLGYIDYTAATWNIDRRRVEYGMQMQANQVIRISSPSIAVKDSSDTSKTAIYGFTGTKRWKCVESLRFGHNMSSASWVNAEHGITCINGIVTSVW